MAVTSGIYANVSIKDTDVAATAVEVIECTGWTMDRTAVDGAYASNKTNGNRRRVTGTKDTTGTITGVYDPALPIEAVMQIGDRKYLQLHVPNATDILGHKLYVRIVGGPNYGGDIEEGHPPKWTVNWAADDNTPLFNVALIIPT